MNMLRGFSRGIAVFLLFVVLLVAPLVIGLQATVNSPEVVKALLDKNNTYETLTTTDLLLDSSRFSSATLADPAVKSAFDSAIPPSYVKASSEKVIDSMYVYVRGGENSPELSVDVTDAKVRFADNVANYIKQKFEALPRCNESKISSTSIESLLEAICTPLDVSPQQASEDARNEIMNQTLFSNDRLDLAAFMEVRESLFHFYLSEIRAAYPFFISLVYILPIAGSVLAIGILFLAHTRRQGIKLLANNLMGAGIVGILAALVVAGIVGMILIDGSEVGLTVAGSVTGAVSALFGDLRMWWLGGAGLLVLVSVVMYILLSVTSRHDHENIAPESVDSNALQ